MCHSFGYLCAQLVAELFQRYFSFLLKSHRGVTKNLQFLLSPKIGRGGEIEGYLYILLKGRARVPLGEPLLNFDIHTGITWTAELST